jgi:fructose/tagatose bisphosphate aldolase
MPALRDVLTRLEKEGVAVGHFNVAGLVLLEAVLGAAFLQHYILIIGCLEPGDDAA